MKKMFIILLAALFVTPNFMANEANNNQLNKELDDVVIIEELVEESDLKISPLAYQSSNQVENEFDQNGYLIRSKVYNQNHQLIEIIDYITHTTIETKDNRIKTIFFIRNDGTINHSINYLTPDGLQDLVAVEYFDGARYNVNHQSKLKFVFYLNADMGIKYGVGYNEQQQREYAYEYFAGTTFGSHGGKLSYLFRINNDFTIQHAYGLNNNQKVEYAFQYFDGAKFGSHGNKSKYVFKLFENYTIEYAYGLDVNQNRINAFEYFPGSVFGSHGNRIKLMFFINNDNVISKAYELNESQKFIAVYEYHEGAKFASHGRMIKFQFIIDNNFKISYANGFSNYEQKLTHTYYYLEPTYYGQNHGARVSRVVDHTVQFASPINNALITCAIGCYEGHNGIDMKDTSYGYNAGAPIMSVSDGTVAYSGFHPDNGNFIIINHHNGYLSYYGHLSVRSVAAGNTVNKGQLIGKMGDTGLADGVHLHFELRLGSVTTNQWYNFLNLPNHTNIIRTYLR